MHIHCSVVAILQWWIRYSVAYLDKSSITLATFLTFSLGYFYICNLHLYPFHIYYFKIGLDFFFCHNCYLKKVFWFMFVDCVRSLIHLLDWFVHIAIFLCRIVISDWECVVGIFCFLDGFICWLVSLVQIFQVLFIYII